MYSNYFGQYLGESSSIAPIYSTYSCGTSSVVGSPYSLLSSSLFTPPTTAWGKDCGIYFPTPAYEPWSLLPSSPCNTSVPNLTSFSSACNWGSTSIASSGYSCSPCCNPCNSCCNPCSSCCDPCSSRYAPYVAPLPALLPYCAPNPLLIPPAPLLLPAPEPQPVIQPAPQPCPDCDKYRQQLSEEQHRRAVAENQVAQLQHELQRLQEQLAVPVGPAPELLEARDHATDLEHKLHDDEKVIGDISNKLKATDDQLKETQKHAEEVEQKLQEDEEIIVNFQKKLKITDEELEAAQTQIAELKAKALGYTPEEISAMQRRLAECEGSKTESETRVANFEKRLKSCNEQLDAANTQIAQLKAAAGAPDQAVAALRRQLEDCEGERSEVQARTANFEQRWKSADEQLTAANKQVAQLQEYVQQVEAELRKCMAQVKEAGSRSSSRRSSVGVEETYKVKTFEIAAQLDAMDGKGDGTYQGLPIEVEGEGLYSDLVKAGRTPKAGAPTGNIKIASGGTYVVDSMEEAEKASKLSPNDDGTYNGMPIEVKGKGLYRDLRGKP